MSGRGQVQYCGNIIFRSFFMYIYIHAMRDMYGLESPTATRELSSMSLWHVKGSGQAQAMFGSTSTWPVGMVDNAPPCVKLQAACLLRASGL